MIAAARTCANRGQDHRNGTAHGPREDPAITGFNGIGQTKGPSSFRVEHDIHNGGW